MAFQPLRYCYFNTFKSLPEWKRDLRIVEEMEKAAHRIQKDLDIADKLGDNVPAIIDFPPKNRH